MSAESPLTANRAHFYSPFAFLKAAHLGAEWLNGLNQNPNIQRFVTESGVDLCYQLLTWDTEFFGTPIYRLDFSSWSHQAPKAALVEAYQGLRCCLGRLHEAYYLFAEVPSEDLEVIQALTTDAWRLVETRLTYFSDDIQSVGSHQAVKRVRTATEADIPDLRQCAIESVNPFDRFHADDFFSPEQADRFMGAFIENSVKGFADEVIVPASGVANAFLTGNYLQSPQALSGRNIGKMVLSAVSPQRRGWYVRLIAALTARFQAHGCDTVFMATQATNRAVLRVWHSFGYQFGRSTHIFSTDQRLGTHD